MLKYKIYVDEGERTPIPEAIFEDKKYDLAGTFLIAEARTFGEEILDTLEEVTSGKKKSGAFAGNVFSLEIRRDKTLISDDISGRELEIATSDLQKIAAEYWEVSAGAKRGTK